MSQVLFIVYSLADRSISRVGVCQDSDLPLQAQSGEAVVEAAPEQFDAARSGALTEVAGFSE